jgi:alkaline phosphatase
MKIGAAAAIGPLLVGGLNPSAQAQQIPGGSLLKPGRSKADQIPERVIFLVSDGMSMGVPAMAEPFSQLVRGRSTHWGKLLQGSADQGVIHGWQATGSLNSMVTDSAAAATAWGSGSKTHNGMINTLPDGRIMKPIGALLAEAGHRLGLVTTTSVTHATPAGFASSWPFRSDQHVIATQYLNRADVVLGGGTEFFDPDQRPDGRNLLGEFSGADYRVCLSRDELMRAGRAQRVLGLFDEGHLPYTLDRNHDAKIAKQVPTLAEMTQAALNALDHGSSGKTRGRFLLLVEGGRVDHAAHANDAASLLWDQLAFDDALGIALAYAAEHPGTLVVTTSDHGNANPGLNGMGRSYADSTECFQRLARARGSFAQCLQRLRSSEGVGKAAGPKAEAERVRKLVAELQGVELSELEAWAVAEALAGDEAGTITKQQRNPHGLLGQAMANHHGVGFTGTSHTSDWTLLSAIGPGAERFGGLQQNTSVFGHLSGIFDVEHVNPALKADTASVWGRENAPAPGDGVNVYV